MHVLCRALLGILLPPAAPVPVFLSCGCVSAIIRMLLSFSWGNWLSFSILQWGAYSAPPSTRSMIPLPVDNIVAISSSILFSIIWYRLSIGSAWFNSFLLSIYTNSLCLIAAMIASASSIFPFIFLTRNVCACCCACQIPNRSAAAVILLITSVLFPAWWGCVRFFVSFSCVVIFCDLSVLDSNLSQYLAFQEIR